MRDSITRILRGCALVISVVVAGLLLYELLYSPVTAAPRKATASRLKYVQFILQTFQTERPGAVEALIGGGNLDANRLRQFFMSERLDPLRDDDIAKLVVDAWEHPLNVSTRADLLTHDPTVELLKCPGDVLAWSSGADGTNQFGRGDDVSYIPDK